MFEKWIEIEVIKTDVKELAIDNIACGYESMAWAKT